MPKKVQYNPADRAADLALMRMQGRIKGIYAEAEEDISKKLADFTARFKAKDAQYQQDLKDGKITQADYDSWRRGQVFQGKRWKDMREEMAAQIYRANKTATEIINGERRVVFQQNANYTAYQIEKDTKGAVNFNLYDSATVTRLLKEDKKLLPDYKINEKKDYKWNNSKINNAVTQGIIQGESLDKIEKRLTESLEAGNRSQMMTFARTAMTGAQNAGRVEAMHDAEDMGIKVKKLWIATLDDRTRDTHAELDGQSVDVDEPFVVDGMEIMYPGDPNADPSLVYNCRCTIGYEYPEYASHGQRRDNETGEVIEYQTYQEWKSKKESLVDQLNIAMQNDIMPLEGQIPVEYDGDFSDFDTLTLRKEEREKLDLLHQMTVRDGFEYGCVSTEKGFSEPFTSRMPDRVQIPDHLLQNKHITLFHSHTNETLLSAKDFELLTNPNVDRISVKSINGDVFSAYIGNGYRPTREEFRDAEIEIRRDVDTSMIAHPEFFSWTIPQRQYMCIREEAYRIARHFGWTLEGGRE